MKAAYTPGEIAVYKAGNAYYWWDEPIWGEDLNREECSEILNVHSETACHVSLKSIIWDSMDGFTDEIQREESLPDGLYIVTYFWWDGRDLLQLCDHGISKQQIIENVKNQKYREGADYFLIEGSVKP